MLLYTSGMIGILYTVDLRNISLLKDTILWFCFTGIIFAFSSATSSDDENVFSSIFVESLKVVVLFEIVVIVLFEFLIGTYTFSLVGELALIPIVTLVVLVGEVARTQKRFAPVARLATGVQVIICYSLLLYAIVQAISQYPNWWTIDTVRQVLLAPILSILFAPFIHLMLVYTGYDSLFIRLRTALKKPKSLQRYAKRRLIMRFGVNIKKIRAFSRVHALDLMRIQTKDGLDQLL